MGLKESEQTAGIEKKDEKNILKQEKSQLFQQTQKKVGKNKC